ncbi:MAG: KH domain-containing protein [Bacilli bacterium]|nr:KH domain-containing protein [Bacilli bacterium]
MKKTLIEGKNLEEVQAKAVELFKEPLERLKIEVVSEKKGFLGIGSSVSAYVSINVNPIEETLTFLKKVMSAMDINANIEVETDTEEVRYNIESDNNPILIGREGKTIEALQYLARHVYNKYSNDKRVCTIDVGGYKQKRRMQLEILATKVAKEVARTKIEVKLDPMNSYERRIIHTKLADWRDVYTESVGEEPNRRLVIKPRKHN